MKILYLCMGKPQNEVERLVLLLFIIKKGIAFLCKGEGFINWAYNLDWEGLNLEILFFY